MFVPFGVRDFLDRAAAGYGTRLGAVDEPDQPAEPLGSLGYGRLADLAEAMAAGLDALEVRFGERVAVLSPNSTRLLACLYGVCGYGRVLVPIDHLRDTARAAQIIADTGARVLLVDPEFAGQVPPIPGVHRFTLGNDEFFRFGVPAAPWPADETAAAMIVHSGAQLSHRTMWVTAVTLALHTGLSDRDVYLHAMPMCQANAWGMPLAAAGVGATQVMLREPDGTEILHRVAEHRVTVLCVVPELLDAVLAAARCWPGETPGRDRVRVIVAGAVPPRMVELVHTELGWEFLRLHGPAGGLLTVNRQREEWDDLAPHELATRLAMPGAPVLGVSLRVNAGAVLARGNTVFDGHGGPRGNPAGWWRTGDQGVLAENGDLTIFATRESPPGPDAGTLR